MKQIKYIDIDIIPPKEPLLVKEVKCTSNRLFILYGSDPPKAPLRNAITRTGVMFGETISTKTPRAYTFIDNVLTIVVAYEKD